MEPGKVDHGHATNDGTAVNRMSDDTIIITNNNVGHPGPAAAPRKRIRN
jgi:hypothetical protein